jgi:signal transduction histidine kinase
LNALVRATLDYAILERADMALNLAAHDFTALIPAIADYVKRDVTTGIDIRCDVQLDATSVVVDAHLMEAVVKNLLYNASRYAKSRIQISFKIESGVCNLVVDDDGPGIPTADRQRVFASFVQLDPKRTDDNSKKPGFGLGLAIVRRAIEWHDGHVEALASPLGGARFAATWPEKRAI